ncbi:MAG TPA: rhomboid family intramembrane serine protease [Steroidobacteraceae bacterium]|nr:rhomboid family intramembrane serine protease [Steroidobacteraceae bacterium]
MFDRVTPTNKAIILANVGIFVLQLLLRDVNFGAFALWPLQTGLFRPWQLLTYGFLHGGLPHIFFNMFAIFMFGSEVERLFGSRRYLIYYLACVVGAALMHIIVLSVADGLPLAPTVGASGGVFGLLLAFGMAYPRRELIIFPIPVPIQAWLAVTLYGALELFLGVTRTASGIAHFAHLGGMATGFVLIRYWQAQRRRPRQ